MKGSAKPKDGGSPGVWGRPRPSLRRAARQAYCLKSKVAVEEEVGEDAEEKALAREEVVQEAAAEVAEVAR